MHKIEVNVGTSVTEANRRQADENREHLDEHGIRAIDILGAVGSGKTMLIEKLTPVLRNRGYKVGAIVGDCYGDDDYQRIHALDIPTENLNTGTECHLDAHMVHHALHHLPLDKIDILLVENVGNMVCPTDFPVGSHKRVVIVSVTEGDDVVNKHPAMFRECEIGIINKVDLAEAVGASVARMEKDMKRHNSNIKILKTNLRKGTGVDALADMLIQ
ncbi:MAG: putative hydrogenase nickel incorporation protein HypB [Methanocella sp. PtaU1.Bin125]|nr:MAG: putative hydrogenase nickel incorporation protein HypB [Methanocella sp. PtaU1.Bin125]